MRTVRTGDGDTYLLVKQSSDSSLVRDPATGDEFYVENADLEAVDAAPLETAATAVDGDLRRLVTAVRSERALGVLVDLHRQGARPVRGMLDAYDLCESDLLGTVTEFRAAGLVEETTVGGERGYALTDAGEHAVTALLDA